MNRIHEITLETLPDPIRINPAATAIIVVDMQNAFVAEGGYFDLVGFNLSATKKIISPCKEIIRMGHKKGMKVIYLQMGYSPDLSDSGGPNSPSFYKSRALTLMRERPELKDRLQIYGTWGANIIDELKPQSGDIIVKKQKHDGFIGTNLDVILKTYSVKYLLFIGTATNICVESTLRHASSLGYFPILVSDATSPLGTTSSQEATIFNIQSVFGWVISSEKLLSAIRGLQSSLSG